MDLHQRFPTDFLFGVATAAYQIEGAVHEDGRGASIWDTFSHQSGRIHNGDTGDVACDHYHRWASDLDLIASLNVAAYRFSIAWPRVFPDGRGAVNSRGLDFYDRLVDGCLERNLQPFATLYHWDLPERLAAQGGWTNRGTADAFADYAGVVTERLGDRVAAVTTFNEPWCSSYLAHLYGEHAPGEYSLDKAIAVMHGQHRAHGLAVQAIHASRSSLPVGVVLNLQAVIPATDSNADRDAAERHRVFHNDTFLGPLFEGCYPEAFIDALSDRLPDRWRADMADIHQPLDYWGLNYYTPTHVTCCAKATNEFPATRILHRAQVKRTDIGWEIDASSLQQVLKDTCQRYELPPCYITENGCCDNTAPENDVVNDTMRLQYLEDHLQVLADTIEQGIDVRGYFAWSLMDNFEWAEGYAMRFGMVYVNYESQQRLIKESGKWFASLAAQHAVTS